MTWDNGRTIKTDLLSSSELSTLSEHTWAVSRRYSAMSYGDSFGRDCTEA